MTSHPHKHNPTDIHDNSIGILIAEDEPDIQNLIKLTLSEAGYTVYIANDGIEALTVLMEHAIDLAVLDIMMPKLDGINLLREIRKTNNIPVILLSARSDEIDRVIGLGAGADDYMAKPFSASELVARVAAQLRRLHEYSANNQREDQITIGSLVLDNDGCVLYKNGDEIELSAMEYKLLHRLMSSPGKAFTKRQLYREVWDDEFYYDDNTIMVHISRLRSKIEDDVKDPQYIKTIRGIGYKFLKGGEPGEK